MASKNSITLEQPGLLTVARSKTGGEFKCRRIVREGRRLFVLAGFASIVGFGAWASHTTLTAVTRATGTVVPPGSNQIVQHFEGGIVGDILVEEGDRVAAGDPLLRLEDSRWTAAMAQSRVERATKLMQRARLEAEANGVTDFIPPLIDGARSAGATEALIFQRRQASLAERTAIYEDQIRRFTLEIKELTARKDNLATERLLLGERVGSLRRLAEQRAVSRNELLSALTTLQQLETKIADAENQLPQVQAELEETRKRKREVTTAAQADSAAQLAELDLEIAKLDETIASLRDRESRSAVRAPLAGVVNKLFVTTQGGVVSPGQEIAEIVPDSEALVVSAKLAPGDRGKVWTGMKAIVKITAYDFAIHGGLEAMVEDISADVISDENDDRFYRVRLSATDADFGPEYPILPGMVAQVDILAEDKTVLQSLIEPLTAIRDTALRE